MAWTQNDLDTLDAAIVSGVRSVKFSDREMEYQSISEMLVARTEVYNSLVKGSAGAQVRMVQIYTKNGF